MNHPRNDGATPLSISAARGFAEIVQILLDNGANLSQLQPDGSDALYVAAGFTSFKNCF